MKSSHYTAKLKQMVSNCPFCSASLAEKNDDSFKRLRSSMTKKIIIILFAFLFSLSLYGAEKKYALVIGNADYEDETLSNPIYDSQDMADALTDIGFTVELLQNADKNTMQETIERFSRTIENADVALLYFAGHGIESDGKNYLLPINMKNITKASLPDNSISLDYVLHQLRYAEALTNIIILDSARNSPFLQTIQSNSRGLQVVQNPPYMNSFLFFATAPGQITEDGKNRNSPFTESLLENIKTPGVEIEQLAKIIRQDVRIKTDNRQNPWSASNLSTSFYFVDGSENDQTTVLFSGSVSLKLFSSNKEMPVSITDSGVYRVSESFPSGTEFQIYLQNDNPAYMYAFASDSTTGKVSKIFPYDNSVSATLNYASDLIVYPSENVRIQMDSITGTDYLIVLYSKYELPFDEICNRFEISSENFVQRVSSAVGSNFVTPMRATYSSDRIAFSTVTNDEKAVFAILIEIPHHE